MAIEKRRNTPALQKVAVIASLQFALAFWSAAVHRRFSLCRGYEVDLATRGYLNGLRLRYYDTACGWIDLRAVAELTENRSQ